LNINNNKNGSEEMKTNDMKTTTKTTNEKPDLIWVCYEIASGIPHVLLVGDEAAARQWWKEAVEDVHGDTECQYNEGTTALESWVKGFFGSMDWDTEYRLDALPFTKGVVA